jgi:Ca2+-binding EF-hand superfamily protein
LSNLHFIRGDFRVFTRYFSLAALGLMAAAAPAAAAIAAAPAPAKPAAAPARPAAAPAAAPNRTAVLNSMAANFKAIDTNGDGTLSAAELQAAEAKVQQNRINAIRQRVEGEFTKLDTNRDGQLSKAEFMAAAPTSATTPANGAALLSQLDKSKDGKVTLDEYRAPILARFDGLDTNHDGVISDAERKAAAAKR